LSAPHIHLQGFSAPAVNHGVVEILCTIGSKPVVIAGSEGIMCSFARDVLAACGQRQPGSAPTPAAPKTHGNTSADLARKCAAIAADLATDSSRGRQKFLCEKVGVNPAVFIRWRHQQQHSALTSADNPRA
jgi:hypothetical protein